MFGQNSQLTQLAARKRMLVVESELNRAQFLRAVQDWKGEALHLAGGVRAAGSSASMVIKAAAVFSILRRLFFGKGGSKEKIPWLSTLFKGTRAGTFLWLLLRSCRRAK